MVLTRETLIHRYGIAIAELIPLQLTVKEVAERILEAHKNGTLQCDVVEEGHTGCRYGSDGPLGPNTICCAIGASVPPDLRSVFDNYPTANIGALLEDGLVRTDNGHSLRELQRLHDCAVTHKGRPSGDIYRAALYAMAAALCGQEALPFVGNVADNAN